MYRNLDNNIDSSIREGAMKVNDQHMVILHMQRGEFRDWAVARVEERTDVYYRDLPMPSSWTVADPSVLAQAAAVRHEFMRGPDRLNGGPPESYCAICGFDPHNRIHFRADE